MRRLRLGPRVQMSSSRAPGEVPIKEFTLHLQDGTLEVVWSLPIASPCRSDTIFTTCMFAGLLSQKTPLKRKLPLFCQLFYLWYVKFVSMTFIDGFLIWHYQSGVFMELIVNMEVFMKDYTTI